MFVKVLVFAVQAAQLAVQEPDVGEVGVPVGFRTAAAGVNAVVTVVLGIVHQLPQGDGAAGNGLAGVVQRQFLEVELFDGLFILPVGCQRRLCGGVSGIVVAAHLGQTGVLDLHAIINPILRRHPGNGIAVCGGNREGGIEALAVGLRAHPLHGHLVVGRRITLAVDIAIGSQAVVCLAVIVLIGLQQIVQLVFGVVDGLSVEDHITRAGGHIVHAVSIGVVGNDLHIALAAIGHVHRNGLDLGVSASGIHGVDGVASVVQRVLIGVQGLIGVADPGNMDHVAVVHPGIEVQVAVRVVVQHQIRGVRITVDGMDQAVGGIRSGLAVLIRDRSLLHLGENHPALVDAVLVGIGDRINDVVGAVRRGQLIGAAGGQAAAQGKGVAGAAVTGILEGNGVVAGGEGKGGDAGVHILLRAEDRLVPGQFTGQDDIDLQDVVIAPETVALDLLVGGVPHEVPAGLLVGILVVLRLTVIGDGELDGVEFKAEQQGRHPEAYAGRHGKLVEYEIVVFRALTIIVRRVVGKNGEGAADADVDEQFHLDDLDAHAHRHLQRGFGRNADAGEIDIAGLTVDGHDPVHDGTAGMQLRVTVLAIIVSGLIIVHDGEFQRVFFTVVLTIHLLRQFDGNGLVTGGADGAGSESLGLVANHFHIEGAAEIDVDGLFFRGIGKTGPWASRQEVAFLRLIQFVVAHVLLPCVIRPSVSADIRISQV